MSEQYSTALSHLILAGTSIYCLHNVGTSAFSFTQVSFGIMAVNSIVGVIRWGYGNHGEHVRKFFRLTTFLQAIFALPCITTATWLQFGYRWELAYAHTFVSIIPLVAYIADNNNSRDLVDLITVVNMLSLGIVSFLEKSWFGVGAAVAYAFSYFVIKEENRDFHGIPTLDCFNYGLCIFAYVSLRALGAGAGAGAGHSLTISA